MTRMPHLVSDKIMTMRIPLTKDRNATIVSAYAPTMVNPEENKEPFYSQLNADTYFNFIAKSYTYQKYGIQHRYTIII